MGIALGKAIPCGLLITLQGTLGAGKTNLVQSIAEGLEIDRTQVVSPTFTLIQVHRGRMLLVHIDAYRIGDEDQYLELGIDEFFDDQHVVAMEWAEKFVEILPSERLDIQIEVVGDEQRTFRFSWSEECSTAAEILGKLMKLTEDD